MDGMRCWSEKLCQFLSHYRWLLDAYIIVSYSRTILLSVSSFHWLQEYFTEGHWSKLPESWQQSLRGASMTGVSQLLLSSPFQRHRSGDINTTRPLWLRYAVKGPSDWRTVLVLPHNSYYIRKTLSLSQKCPLFRSLSPRCPLFRCLTSPKVVYIPYSDV